MSLECCGITNTGCERPDNQDCLLIDQPLGLFAVCDGMGGHQQGELAAELAVNALRFSIHSSRDRIDMTWPFGYDFNLSLDANRLITGVSLANREIWRRSQQTLESTGMGTTVAAVLFSSSTVTIAHVGDSRVYLFRSGELLPLTEDDTMMGGMVQRGLITEEKLRTHPMRNVLMRAVGPQETVDVHVRQDELVKGDVLLLCSDGLHGFVSHAEIANILSADEEAGKSADRLIQATLATGAPDNVSAVVLKYI
jgi:serine/threonine protein phosphatase PrpC